MLPLQSSWLCFSGRTSEFPAALATVVDYDILRQRLRYVYHTFLKEHKISKKKLSALDLDDSDFATVRVVLLLLRPFRPLHLLLLLLLLFVFCSFVSVLV